MKDFNQNVQSARQGEVFFLRIDKIPEGLRRKSAENGVHVLAHSETGHNHVMDAKSNVAIFETDDPLVSYLQIVEATDEVENLLVHLRDHHTHETIKFSPGNYCVVTGRESAPEGWRRVAD